MFFYLRFLLTLLWLVIGCLLSLLLLPFYWRNPNYVRAIGRILSFVPLPLFGHQVELIGAEHLKTQPAICVSNHQSGYDVIIYGKFVPGRSVSIGKKELKWVPFFGLVFWASGSLMIDRSNSKLAMASLEQALKRAVEKKLSLVIFPEGTRNRSGIGMLPFKKGAFHMAIQAQIPVVALVLPRINHFFDWRRGFSRPGRIPIEVLEPIPTTGMDKKDVERLSDLVRQRMLEAQSRLEKRITGG